MLPQIIACPNCKLKVEVPGEGVSPFTIGVCQKCRKIFYTFMGGSYLLKEIDIFNTTNGELRDEVINRLQDIVYLKITDLFKESDFRAGVLEVFEILAKGDMMDNLNEDDFSEYDDIVDEFEDGYQEGFADGANLEFNERTGKMEEMGSFDKFETPDFSSIQEEILSKLGEIDSEEEEPKEEPKKIPDSEVDLFKALLNGNSTVQHLIDLG